MKFISGSIGQSVTKLKMLTAENPFAIKKHYKKRLPLPLGRCISPNRAQVGKTIIFFEEDIRVCQRTSKRAPPSAASSQETRNIEPQAGYGHGFRKNRHCRKNSQLDPRRRGDHRAFRTGKTLTRFASSGYKRDFGNFIARQMNQSRIDSGSNLNPRQMKRWLKWR